MYIDNIRKEVESHQGDKVKIKCNLGRNKYETYEASIEKTYNYVFLVRINDREIKSFSYIDIMTKTIKIDY